MVNAQAPGFVNGAPRLLLRAEGLAIAAASIAAFAWSGGSWVLFAVLILAPDLSMAFYLLGPRVGAAGYNAIHTYVGPLLLVGLAAALAASVGVQVALIWSAHIGIDRVFGFGLKYSDGFGSTHLGQLDRAFKTD